MNRNVDGASTDPTAGLEKPEARKLYDEVEKLIEFIKKVHEVGRFVETSNDLELKNVFAAIGLERRLHSYSGLDVSLYEVFKSGILEGKKLEEFSRNDAVKFARSTWPSLQIVLRSNDILQGYFAQYDSENVQELKLLIGNLVVEIRQQLEKFGLETAPIEVFSPLSEFKPGEYECNRMSSPHTDLTKGIANFDEVVAAHAKAAGSRVPIIIDIRTYGLFDKQTGEIIRKPEFIETTYRDDIIDGESVDLPKVRLVDSQVK